MSFKRYFDTYEFEAELPGTGEIVHFKPIKTKQMKKILTYENSNSISTIEDAIDDVIFKECIISEGFDVKELYLQDRFFLLIKMRMKTRGESYNWDFSCPKCSSQSRQSVDLSKLNIKKYEIKKKKPVDKNKKVSTTETGEKKEKDVVKITDSISVRLDQPKRIDQYKAFIVVSKMEGLTDTQKNAEISTILHANSIKSVITPDGEEITGDDRLADKIELLDELTQDEYDKITKWLEDYDFGIDFKMEVNCPHCGYNKIDDIPMDNFFF